MTVVDAGEPHSAPAARMQGFLSPDGTTPRDLLPAGRVEVEDCGGQFVSGRCSRKARR